VSSLAEQYPSMMRLQPASPRRLEVEFFASLPEKVKRDLEAGKVVAIVSLKGPARVLAERIAVAASATSQTRRTVQLKSDARGWQYLKVL